MCKGSGVMVKGGKAYVFKKTSSGGAGSQRYFWAHYKWGWENLNNRKTHISHVIMGPKYAALFFLTMDTEGEASVREQGREEEENDWISPWEQANER